MTLSNDPGEGKRRNRSTSPVFPENSDIPALVQICRRSFMDSIRWQGLPKVAQRCWENILSSNATEAYIIRFEHQIVAFCLLITDEIAYKLEMDRKRIPLWLRILSGMACPLVFAQQLVLKIRTFFKSKGETDDLSVSIPWKTKERTWVELIAVHPSFRGRGFARKLLQICDQRTQVSGKKAVVLKVDSHNQAARKLYEEVGYVQMAKNTHGVYYAKTVSAIDNSHLKDFGD